MRGSSQNRDRLIVALDTQDLEEVEGILKALEGAVSFYKVGSELFTAHGWEAVRRVRSANARVFLDLKFHDIPNTVSKTAAVVCAHEIEMFNVHALGGFEMMRSVRETVDQKIKDSKKKPVVLAVTILTSHAETELARDLGIQKKLSEEVLHLAKLAERAGLDGVVCSPHEIGFLRPEFPENFIMVTPGIRPSGSAKGDQKRTLSPAEAILAGADYIVVGRPITASKTPREEALRIIQSIEFPASNPNS